MKIYAINDNNTIITFSDPSLAPKNAKQFEVNHVDQLKIVDDEIVIDKTILDSKIILQNIQEKNSKINILKNEIFDLIIEQQLSEYNIISEIDENKLKEKLIEYNELKK